MYSTSKGCFIETWASEIERKQRTGNVDVNYIPPTVRRPRLKKTIHCQYCGNPLWVGKTPKPFKCPSCRAHIQFPCDRCDWNCDKTMCRYDDGEYYEEAVWVRGAT